MRIASFMENKQVYLALLSLVADVIAIVTLWLSANTGGGLQAYLAIIILAIVNTAVIIVAYLAIKDSQKYFEQYKNIDNELDKRDSTIKTLTESLSNLSSDQIKIARITHNFCHEYREKLAMISGCGTRISGTDYQIIKNKFQKFLLFSMANIKEAFDIFTHDECAVCIKIITDDNEVKTLIRDPVSYRVRHEADIRLPSFPLHGNTAFSEIINPHAPSIFISNSLGAEQSYINNNPAWKKYYSACIVVPIRVMDSDGPPPEYRVIGFLCVDNMKGGFDPDLCGNILAAFGDLYFNLFQAFGAIEQV
jgi:hypothetical protein